MSQVLTHENLGIEGFISIDLIPEGSDRRIPYFFSKNRITNAAREHLLRMVVDSPAVLTANPIIEFRVGTGGTGQVINGTEIGLFTELDPIVGSYTPTSITSTYIIGNSRIVDIQFTLSTAEANGYNLDEVGLFCQNGWMNDLVTYGRMFNIKNFPAITKTAAFSVAFTWRINFSGVC